MKVLLDSCTWGPAAEEIRAAGHEVEWVGDWKPDPGDEEILKIAIERKAVVVTLDKDFGEMAVVNNIRHSGIIRLVGFSARDHAGACIALLEAYGEELSNGAIVTAADGRARVRSWQE